MTATVLVDAGTWREDLHPRIPGGEHGGEFTHSPGSPGGGHLETPTDLAPGGGFPRAHGRITRRLTDELAAQMPGWRHELERHGSVHSVPLSRVHTIHPLFQPDVRSRRAAIRRGEPVPSPVAIYDKATDRWYLLDQAESAEAYRLEGYENTVMTVLTPRVQKEKPKHTGGGLNRQAVDDWLRLRLADKSLPGEVRVHLEAAREAHRKNNAQEDKHALGRIREAGSAAYRLGKAEHDAGRDPSALWKLEGRLKTYADKIEKAQAPRPGPDGAPKFGPDGKVDRAAFDAWVGGLVDQSLEGGRDAPQSGSRHHLGTVRYLFQQGRDGEAAEALRKAGAGATRDGQPELAKVLFEAAKGLESIKREDTIIRGRGVSEALVKDVLRGRDQLGQMLGTPDSRFHGELRKGASRRIAGSIGWRGEMFLENAVANQLQAMTKPGAPEQFRVDHPDAARTVLHELLHGAGEGSDHSARADGEAYGFTTSGREIEEGFTELGTRLLLPEFVDRMGWGDHATTGGRTMHGWATYVDSPSMFGTEGGWGSYHKLVRSAWTFSERVAYDEGASSPRAIEKRAREIAVQIATAQTSKKVGVMADLAIRAKGQDPAEVIKTKGGTSISRHDLVSRAIQQSWKRATSYRKDPHQAMRNVLAQNTEAAG